jgi:hypothetical protein
MMLDLGYEDYLPPSFAHAVQIFFSSPTYLVPETTPLGGLSNHLAVVIAWSREGRMNQNEEDTKKHFTEQIYHCQGAVAIWRMDPTPCKADHARQSQMRN